MKKKNTICVWAILFSLFAGALICTLLPHSLTALTGLDHAEIEWCGITVMNKEGAGLGVSGEELESLLKLLEGTKVKLCTSHEALDTLRTKQYWLHFYCKGRDAISFVIWENNCIEYQEIVYEICGEGDTALTYDNITREIVKDGQEKESEEMGK